MPIITPPSSNKFAGLKDILLTPIHSRIQMSLILAVALAFIWLPQAPPIDWNLITDGFWKDIPHTYINNENLVNAPWGLIMLLPVYLIRAAGTRVLSVLVIGWLVHSRKWPFMLFFAAVLSPFFLYTMVKSNIDILVMILPVLVWEAAGGKRWESLARGLALVMMLIKPQTTYLLLIYLLWTNRRQWQALLQQVAVAALIILPTSLMGAPPLILQWLDNILFHPSEQNQVFWSVNNLSLSTHYGWLSAFGILLLAGVLLYLLVRSGRIAWGRNQKIYVLLLSSMFLSPYTSQQCFSGALSYVPSWPGFLLQYVSIGLGALLIGNFSNVPPFFFSIAFLSLLFFSWTGRAGT